MSYWSLRDNRSVSPEDETKVIEYEKIYKLATNVYETTIDGIPDYLVEKLLFEDGKCLFWYSPTLGHVVTRCQEVGWDINGEPNAWKPILEVDNGEKEIDIPECITYEDGGVAFYDSRNSRHARRNVLKLISEYIDVKSTIRTQIYNQKTPMLGIVSDTRIKSKVRDFIQALSKNAQAIILDSDTRNSISTFDVNPVFNVEKLWQYAKTLENEILEFLGIDSRETFMKKERLIVDEQEGNDELLNYILADGLKARQTAVDKINALGGPKARTEICKSIRPVYDGTIIEEDINDTKA